MMKKIVVGIGEILWDVFGDKKVLGGAPANFSYHISQFGYEGYTVSAVGNDDNGKEILLNLQDKDLKHIIHEVDFPTGTVQVTLDKEGIPQYEICENVAWDNIPFDAKIEQLASKTDAVCFGSLAQRNVVSHESIKNFIHHMPTGSLKIFDINLRQHFYTKEMLMESMKMANVLKINDEEAVIVADLFGYDDMEEDDICKRLQNNYDFDVVILTKGVRGSCIFTKSEVSMMSTPVVEVVDTVGAGDSFTAAFVALHLQKKPLKESHQLAVEVAAYVCTQQGAMPLLPDHYTSSVKNKM